MVITATFMRTMLSLMDRKFGICKMHMVRAVNVLVVTTQPTTFALSIYYTRNCIAFVLCYIYEPHTTKCHSTVTIKWCNSGDIQYIEAPANLWAQCYDISLRTIFVVRNQYEHKLLAYWFQFACARQSYRSGQNKYKNLLQVEQGRVKKCLTKWQVKYTYILEELDFRWGHLNIFSLQITVLKQLYLRRSQFTNIIINIGIINRGE